VSKVFTDKNEDRESLYHSEMAHLYAQKRKYVHASKSPDKE